MTGGGEGKDHVKKSVRINEQTYQTAKAEAARRGITLTRFVEDAVLAMLFVQRTKTDEQIAERNRFMEELLSRTSHFKIGAKPTREEMNRR